MTRDTSFIIAILLFVGAQHICGDDDIKGRLLTPEEGCGLTKVKNTRIVGGTEAPVGAWPWMALLGAKVASPGRIGGFFFCGGSLITSKHVLTAAHCIDEDLYFVRLGEHDLNRIDDGPHQDILVARGKPHERYDPGFKLNDIGIVHLEQDVEFSDRIRPVCLPLDEPLLSREFGDANPFVAGWGSMNEEEDVSNVLLQLQVPIIDNKLCKKLVYAWGAIYAEFQIRDHVLCAGIACGSGIWSGDSGGPLMLPIHQNGTFPFYQIGVVSFGYSCAEENVPGIYSKVQFHADWIKKQLESSADDEQAKGLRNYLKSRV